VRPLGDGRAARASGIGICRRVRRITLSYALARA
jgi:hypothetical protein